MVKQRFRNSIGDVKTLPGADIDSEHKLLVAELGRGNQNGIFEKINRKENHVKEVIEQKLCQIDGVTGSVEDNWGKVKETLSIGYLK